MWQVLRADVLQLGVQGLLLRLLPPALRSAPELLLLFFIALDLEFSDTNFHEPQIRALLGTASDYCEAVVFQSRTVPSGTALGLSILRVVRRGAQAMYNLGV